MKQDHCLWLTFSCCVCVDLNWITPPAFLYFLLFQVAACFPPVMMKSVFVCVCLSSSWVKVSTRSSAGYWGETWFLVGHPGTDSPFPGETHFALKGEINTATNLDFPLSSTHSHPIFFLPFSPFTCKLLVYHKPFRCLKDKRGPKNTSKTEMFSLPSFNPSHHLQTSILMMWPWVRN